MSEQPLSPAEFGVAFTQFIALMSAQENPHASPLLTKFQEHLGEAPTTIPVITEEFDSFEHPNLQLALDAYCEQPGRTVELVGIAAENKRYMVVSLSDLVARTGAFGQRGLTEGPVDYVTVHLAGERVLACVQFGLYLIREGDDRLIAFVCGPTESGGPRARLRVEVLANRPAVAQAFLAALRVTMQERNVYLQQVISLTPGQFGPGPQNLIAFHQLPTISREAVILPEGVLERIERSTIVFGEHVQQLAAAGRSLKRGMLLYGAPGVGKTLTTIYLIGQMPQRTTILATGLGLGLLPAIVQLARTLAPALVVLEDVDLIAEDRMQMMGRSNPILFELLNAMDGLQEDSDILFLLTTNRPETLEPALAARPGRIDEVIALPLPDAADRRRLLLLYGEGLDLRQIDLDALVERTAGASPAYLKELLRKAAVLAVAEQGNTVLQEQQLAQVFEEIAAGGVLAETILGGRQAASGPGPHPAMAVSAAIPGYPAGTGWRASQ